MENSQLIKEIFGGDLFSPDFLCWLENKRFKAFVETNNRKISSKIAKAQRGNKAEEFKLEDLRDVLHELAEAYLLLSHDLFAQVEHEKYSEKEGGPDFTVTCTTGAVFNLEVKRIRNTPTSKRLEEWGGKLRKFISEIEPSDLALSIFVDDIDDESANPTEWLTRLEEQTETIFEYIYKTHAWHIEQNNIPQGTNGPPHYIPGFNNHIELVFRKPMQKVVDAHKLYLSSSSSPILKTGHEYIDVFNKIVEKLKQMKPDMMNVLVISTSSETHRYFNFLGACSELREVIEHSMDDGFFEDKGFANANDFFEKRKIKTEDFCRKICYLSGIVFRSFERPIPFNPVWCNPHAASASRLPLDVEQALQKVHKDW